jgi:hypothetical protein
MEPTLSNVPTDLILRHILLLVARKCHVRAEIDCSIECGVEDPPESRKNSDFRNLHERFRKLRFPTDGQAIVHASRS